MPPAKKAISATRPPTASWSEPLSPWPLVQPPAIRAPNMTIAPPMKATAPLISGFVPNRDSHMFGTACHLKLRDVMDETKEPMRMPATNIHCQSIRGVYLVRYGVFATCSGAMRPSMKEAVRTMDVEAPKYFPVTSTDRIISTPANAPAR